jgi:hypothetical protein
VMSFFQPFPGWQAEYHTECLMMSPHYSLWSSCYHDHFQGIWPFLKVWLWLKVFTGKSCNLPKLNTVITCISYVCPFWDCWLHLEESQKIFWIETQLVG